MFVMVLLMQVRIEGFFVRHIFHRIFSQRWPRQRRAQACFGPFRGGSDSKFAPRRNTCDLDQPRDGRLGESEDCKTGEPSRERSGRTESSPELSPRSTARTPHLGTARDLLPVA